jgi:hypothetical protein
MVMFIPSDLFYQICTNLILGIYIAVLQIGKVLNGGMGYLGKGIVGKIRLVSSYQDIWEGHQPRNLIIENNNF